MSAEFRTLCHSLGLSAKAVAKLAQVEQRTVSYWFAKGKTPAGVLEDIQRIDGMIEQIVLETLEQAQECADEVGQQPSVLLKAYRDEHEWWAAHPSYKPLPIQTHSIILRRVQAALHRIGYKIDIEYYGQNKTEMN